MPSPEGGLMPPDWDKGAYGPTSVALFILIMALSAMFFMAGHRLPALLRIDPTTWW